MPLTRLAPQHPAPNAASEGHHVSGTFFIAKNALFLTEFGLLDACFGRPMGGPKNDPGEHHRRLPDQKKNKKGSKKNNAAQDQKINKKGSKRK